ncbi:MAG: ATP phosphoribosyltransferase regulatory subunit [Oscillospiraceae bacterium]|nr:ATP phosphoribosyltransferase regulatory subunit [Oscillospiraceae bacterium]
MMQELPLTYQERVIFGLRSLYNRYGYTQYKMSKFEEYDLYARNKDFLVSDRVITFMDTNGRLMALKPDVTLSIVKNTKDAPGALQKLYYNENVYRAAKGNGSFKEIMQVGLECLGDVDEYCIGEVLLLAAESLQAISPDSILDISHLGLLSELIDAIGISENNKSQLLACIGQKNPHELDALCRQWNVASEKAEKLKQLLALSGRPAVVLSQIKALLSDLPGMHALEQLERILALVEDSDMGGILRIDFSEVDDIHYYNGIVFKGFINGVPSSVLSGGQYDKLMRKVGRKAGAVGFAVYMDTLERLDDRQKEYDVDTVLLYGPEADLMQLQAKVRNLRGNGERVAVQRQLPADIRCRRILKFDGSEVEILENNA